MTISNGLGTDLLTQLILQGVSNNSVTPPVISTVQYPLAAKYNFSSSSGLSNDPNLPSYLQDLTPAQLQVALAPDPTGENAYQMMLQTNDNYITSGLNCDDTSCGAGIPNVGVIPSWVWMGLAILGGILIVKEIA